MTAILNEILIDIEPANEKCHFPEDRKLKTTWKLPIRSLGGDTNTIHFISPPCLFEIAITNRTDVLTA